MRKLSRVIVFIVCIPLIGTFFIKPDKDIWKREEDEASTLDEYFEICVVEDIGSFRYKPEYLTELLMYCVIPEDTVFSSSEDYIASADTVQDPEQEYLKALSIVCRSSIVSVWEDEQRPDVLDYDKIQFGSKNFYKIYQFDAVCGNLLENCDRSIKLNEIKQAADATKGAVITRDGKVITAPFFTTTASDMLVSESGDGVGFSLNYAYELAIQGMDFYEILKYFYEDIKVTIYE